MPQSVTVEGGKFSCAACGKQYTWKPQLAGKKAKCACGSSLVVPAAAAPTASPTSAPAPPPSASRPGGPRFVAGAALDF